MDTTEIEKLELELQNALFEIKKRSKVLTLFRVLSYGGSLIYFLGVLVVFNIGFLTNPKLVNAIDNTTVLSIIIPLFILITIGSAGSSYYYSKYISTEQEAIIRIVNKLFPDAEYTNSTGSFSVSKLMLSNLFGNMEREKVSSYSHGTLKLKGDRSPIVLNDISVGNSKIDYWLFKTSIGTLLVVMKYMFKGMFSKRLENLTTNFRGVFNVITLNKKVEGIVIIVPDHLEKHIDYLAKSIQQLSNREGINLIKMENIDFEHKFSVYTTDDILARYILTPARMDEIVKLKGEYHRDMMFSYAFNQFYMAISMPEGLLGLDSEKINKDNSVAGFYANVSLAKNVINNLSNI
ncbi:MAG: DUF3137 domain-containing protein [Flavobacteriaceae bacterium]|jgi:hypothetical protein|nr:DUF3137 domain-containing protein [Flavobacteriaceae bacterium]